jgi:hypothetical protein
MNIQMKNHYFVVADRLFVLGCDDETLRHTLEERYGPFAVSEADSAGRPRLFSLQLEPQVAPLADAREMARFDCEGFDCRYEQTEAMVSITILAPQTEEVWARMVCDRNFEQARASLTGNLARRHYCLNNFLMMLFAFAAMPSETLLFHASVVAREGRAYLFLGKSGTGKSTHSNLWRRYLSGTELVNDDNPAVGIRGDQVVVYGTPWSGKTPCYRRVQFPVGAFVRLHQAPENKISRRSPVQAFADLLPSCSGVKWDTRLYRAQCDTVSEVVRRVPVFYLECLPDEAAARLCHATVSAS